MAKTAQTVLYGMAALEPRVSKMRGIPKYTASDEEYQMQCAYFRFIRMWAKFYPALSWIYAVPNGAGMLPGVGPKMVESGMTAGVWDICVPVPGGFPCTGPILSEVIHGAYIEFKTDDGDLSDDQELFAKAMRSRGYACLVFRNWKEAARWTIAHCGIDDTRINRNLEGK